MGGLQVGQEMSSQLRTPAQEAWGTNSTSSCTQMSLCSKDSFWKSLTVSHDRKIVTLTC
jgi:hypothetical protein